jgi:hypothetical protein
MPEPSEPFTSTECRLPAPPEAIGAGSEQLAEVADLRTHRGFANKVNHGRGVSAPASKSVASSASCS